MTWVLLAVAVGLWGVVVYLYCVNGAEISADYVSRQWLAQFRRGRDM